MWKTMWSQTMFVHWIEIYTRCMQNMNGSHYLYVSTTLSLLSCIWFILTSLPSADPSASSQLSCHPCLPSDAWPLFHLSRLQLPANKPPTVSSLAGQCDCGPVHRAFPSVTLWGSPSRIFHWSSFPPSVDSRSSNPCREIIFPSSLFQLYYHCLLTITKSVIWSEHPQFSLPPTVYF